MRMYQAEHLNRLAETHLISKNTPQTILFLNGKFQAELSRIRIHIKLFSSEYSRKQVIVNILSRPRVLFPQWMHRDLPVRLYISFFSKHPMQCLLLILSKGHGEIF